MTGSGSGAVDGDLGRVEAEVRSVNHRFLKTTLRVQGTLPSLDRLVEDAIKRRAERGHVSVTVRYRPSPSASGEGIDASLFAAAAKRLLALADAEGLSSPTVADVLSFPGVRSGDAPAGDARVLALVEQALDRALDAFVQARRTEGAHLVDDVQALLRRIDALNGAVAREAAATPTALRDRLHERLAELLEGSGVRLEPDQLAREVALLADRADVREELTRLGAHVEHARGVLAEGGPVGRRLDFLVQEMHREANTIGSKSAALSVTHTVVDLKADVERLREQVQNLE